MTDPVFPVPIDIFNAGLAFNDFEAGQPFDLVPGIEVASIPVTCGLPGTAYRLLCGHRSLGYACAIRPSKDLSYLIDFLRGCDLLILSLLCDDMNEADRIAIELAQRAEIGHVVITDHPPEASDSELFRREEAMQRQLPASSLAREGHVIDIPALN